MNKILQKSKPRGTKNNLLPAWDLSDLYQGMTDKQIEKDLAVYQKSAEAFAKKYKGKIRVGGHSKGGNNIKEKLPNCLQNNFLKWRKTMKNVLFWATN